MLKIFFPGFILVRAFSSANRLFELAAFLGKFIDAPCLQEEKTTIGLQGEKYFNTICLQREKVTIDNIFA
jgi:hypothetical protein